jgi:hypothetical protein
MAVDELRIVEQARRDGDVVFLATRIRESEVNEFHIVVLHQLNDIGWGHPGFS